MEENEILKQEKQKLEECLEEKCEEFAEELDKIEESAKQHTKLKEAELITMTKILASEKENYAKLEK